MKLQTKILHFVGFIFILLFVFIYLLVTINNGIMLKMTGAQVATDAKGIITGIDREMDRKIEDASFHGDSLILKMQVKKSNSEFENLTDIQAYVNQQNQIWTSSKEEEITSFMSEILNNEGSTRLKQIQKFYESDRNFTVFSEIFVTNKYGAIVSMTKKTSDYLQDKEDWWQEAKSEGSYVSEVDYDENKIDIASKIVDENGEFIGVILESLSLTEIKHIIEHYQGYLQDNNNNSPEVKIIDNKGKVIYQSKNTPYELKDISNYSVFKSMNLLSGYTIGEEEWEEGEKEESLFAYAASTGFHQFKGFDWKVIIEYDKDSLFAEANSLKKQSLFFSSIFGVLMIVLTLFLINPVSKRIVNLKEITSKIGKGDLSSRAKVTSHDEIGDLTRSINNMANDIGYYQEKLLKSEKDKSHMLTHEVNKKTSELRKNVENLTKTKSAVLNMMSDLKEANENLKKMDKTKSDFLNIVSHELKTPLTAINAHLGVIDDIKGNLNEQELLSLDAIKRNNYLLKTLIDNILEISRIESGKFELNLAKINIKNLIKETKSNLEILSEKKGLKLIVDVDKIPDVLADEMRVREILNNLISNSIKFTEKGWIKISAEKKDKHVVISVIDTGIGIPEDKIKNLFQKFYQVDSSIGRRYGGTGLGLAITKQLVELQGGKINVMSTAGKGSTFSFMLPINNNMKGGAK